MAVQRDGRIIVSRYLSVSSGTVSTAYLARLNADGGVDGSFTVGLDGSAAAFLQKDGKVVITGGFTHVNGVARNGMARLNADGTLDTGFNADASPGGVLGVQADGKLLVRVSGFSGILFAGHSLLRLNADGSVDPGFRVSTNKYIYAMALRPDGKMVLAGDFTLVNGTTRNDVARLNADGSLDAFGNADGGTDGPIYCLALQGDGKLLLGGDFTSVDGVLRNYVARLKPGGAPDFFAGQADVGGGFYYLAFASGNPFGYYNVAGKGYRFPFLYHDDLGMEYFFDAQDGEGGAYLYDFASGTFFYTSPSFPWPYLYDFGLNAVLYYSPDPTRSDHFNTNGIRYFYNFGTGQIISK